MLWTIAVIMFLLWIPGLATAYTISGFIHILLVLAIAVVLVCVIQVRRMIPERSESHAIEKGRGFAIDARRGGNKNAQSP